MKDYIFKETMDPSVAARLAAGAMQLSVAVDYGPVIDVDASSKGTFCGEGGDFNLKNRRGKLGNE